MKKLIFGNRETGTQFVKFAIVGILNTGIHYSVFLVLLQIGRMHYLLASVVGYCAGLINSYVLNRVWTFEFHGNQKRREFAKFVTVNIVALAVNTATLKWFVFYMKMAPEIGQVFAIVFSLTVNFLGNKLWTFRKAHEVV
jgi:putative flippase GtrA